MRSHSMEMRTNGQLLIVLVTTPDRRVARKLAKAALERKLIACANLIFRVESHYWWQGKLETASEALLLFKTTKAKVANLEKLVLKLHPYDTPEFVVLEATRVTQRYLRWAQDSLK